MSEIDDDGEATRGVVLAEAIDRSVRAALAEKVRHLIPARVVKFDPATQKADVKPLVGDFSRDETGALVTRSVPIITGVPVMFLTAGGFTFTVPIQAGDSGTTGALLFADRSLDRWLSGNGLEVVDPELYHRNALADGIFVPGLLTFAAPMSSAPPTDHATAGSIAGVRVHFRDGTICVGDESGSDFLARAQKTLDELNGITGAFNGHKHNVGTLSVLCPNDGSGPVTITPTGKTAAGPSYSPNSVATDQAKGH